MKHASAILILAFSLLRPAVAEARYDTVPIQIDQKPAVPSGCVLGVETKEIDQPLGKLAEDADAVLSADAKLLLAACAAVDAASEERFGALTWENPKRLKNDMGLLERSVEGANQLVVGRLDIGSVRVHTVTLEMNIIARPAAPPVK